MRKVACRIDTGGQIGSLCVIKKSGKRGFALPSILIASVVMLAVLMVAIQAVVASRSALNEQYYIQLAREAAESGLALAESCLTSNSGEATWSNLRPYTDCDDNFVDTSNHCETDIQKQSPLCTVYRTSTVRSTFSVATPVTSADGQTRQISSKGTVERVRKSTGEVWDRKEYTTYAQVGSVKVSQIATSSAFACSLLETKQVYCWGQNVSGAMGPSNSLAASRPVRVDGTGALAGKTISQLARGSFSAQHMCAIAESEVYCWGNNTFGQLGDGSSNGTYNMNPNSVKVASGSGEAMPAGSVTKVAVGENGSCAIAAGKVYCWGENRFGQLGNNNSSMTYSSKPVAVSGIPSSSTATDISYHQNTVCVIASGVLYCWGHNLWLQVGDGTSTDRYSATVVGGLLSGKVVTAIQTSHATTCAIASAEVYCWGNGGQGAVGDGSVTDSSVPRKVANGPGTALYGKNPVKLSAGFHYNCALTSDGKAYCWGYDGGAGQLGDGNLTGNRFTPYEVSGLSAIGSATDISSSRSSTCVLIDGYTYCWGLAYDGQLRSGVQSPTPAKTDGVLAGKTISRAMAGGNTNCTYATDGMIACWGSNALGMIGDGTFTDRLTPVQAGAFRGSSVSDISGADGTVCAIVNSQIWCWGQNVAGKLGDGTNGTNKPNPAQVLNNGVLSGKTPQRIISASGGIVCALASGAPYCWGGYASAPRASLIGNNTIVQANGGFYTSTPVAVYQEAGVLAGKTVSDISGGTEYCVTANGSVYCWGENLVGQLGINASSSGYSKPVSVFNESGVLAGKSVTKLASGNNFVCVVTTEPNIYCWGYNFDGEFGNGSRTSSTKPVLVTTTGHPLYGKSITKLVAGSAHACALTSGEVYCWGYNALGQLGTGNNLNQLYPVKVQGALAGKTVTDLSATGPSTCAVADAKIYCWGSNDFGQIGDGTSQLPASPVPTKALSVPPFVYY